MGRIRPSRIAVTSATYYSRYPVVLHGFTTNYTNRFETEKSVPCTVFPRNELYGVLDSVEDDTEGNPS